MRSGPIRGRILKEELSGFNDKLDKGYERKRVVKDGTKILGSSKQVNRVELKWDVEPRAQVRCK